MTLGHTDHISLDNNTVAEGFSTDRECRKNSKIVPGSGRTDFRMEAFSFFLLQHGTLQIRWYESFQIHKDGK